MANLTDSGRRGQIILVTGFALAVVFVGLALVLNSVIFTENLATRAEITTEDPIQHTKTMNAGTEEILAYINEYNTSHSTDYAELEDNLSAAFGNLTAGTIQHQLTDGQVTNDTLGAPLEGAWIKQNDSTREFTNESGAGDWQLVANADGARSFRIFVNETGLVSDDFTVVAKNSTSGTWQMEIGTTTVNVTAADGTTFQCGSALDTLPEYWVNVSKGTVAGDECDNFDFAGGLDTIQSVKFTNGGDIQGSYRLMVNESVPISASDYTTPPNDPFTEAALYGTNVSIEFARKNLIYRTEIRVIPGENDGS